MEDETSKHRILNWIVILIVIVASALLVLFLSMRNSQSLQEDPPVQTIEVQEEEEFESLSKYFRKKKEESDSLPETTGTQNKQKNCMIDGKIVKEGTVVSGETCVADLSPTP